MLEKYLFKWLLRIALAAAAVFLLVYSGDAVIYKLRGSPRSKVRVNQYVTIPEKGNRSEWDFQGTVDQPCAVALFAQGGYSPCWRLRKNPNPGLVM